MKIVTWLKVMLLLVCIARSVEAIPILRLKGPSETIIAGQDFNMELFVDGVTGFDPIWGTEEFLAFGFILNYPIDFISLYSFTIAAPFNDDSPLFSGPFGGSVFPGLTGDNIFIGTLTFQTHPIGTDSVSVLELADRPDITGLFTSLGRYPISATIGITVTGGIGAVPDQSSTAILVSMSFASVALLRSLNRKR